MNYDKSTWGPGAWQDEPDVIEWMDQGTKLPCTIRRSSGGVLCGYVGVPKDHPLFGKGYDEETTEHLTAHGGLTFAGTMHHDPDGPWWFGFDCAHLHDISPAYGAKYGGMMFNEGRYRTLSYVENECYELARQLVAKTPCAT